MSATTVVWDRESIEALNSWDRPAVRCQVEFVFVDDRGGRETSLRDVNGTIAVDGNAPWVVCQAAGKTFEFRVSWTLLLQVLNDKWVAPILMNQDKPLEVKV